MHPSKRSFLPGLIALMIAPIVALAQSHGDLPSAQAIGSIEAVATFHDAMPTGVTVSENGRIFVNFPRWGDDVPFTVAEVRDGRSFAYPDAAVNRGDVARPGETFLSVQSVVADGRGRLWILDTAAPNFSAPVRGGAKLVAIDLASNRIERTLIFPSEVIDATTYVNDMRFDFRVGKQGVAYVTDSSPTGTGGIIVLDLDSGKAIKRLVGHHSTSADRAFVPIVEGQQLMNRAPDGATAPFTIASDGIALSPDGETLYYSPLSSRRLYSVPTRLLRDATISEASLASAVGDLGDKGASDGLESDALGNLYAGDYEHNASTAAPPQASGRRSPRIHASSGRILYRLGRMASCTSRRISCTVKQPSTQARTKGASPMSCSERA
jgi:sugar lactone lactonase YvrE